MKTLTATLCLILAGCAGAKIKTQEQVSKALGTYKLAHVDLRCTSSDAADIAQAFAGLLISKMAALNVFPGYVAGPDASNADLRLAVTVTGVRRVTAAERALVGAMAGQAKLEVSVELVDVATSERLGAFTVSGRSSSAWAEGQTTGNAVDEAAAGIARYLADRR